MGCLRAPGLNDLGAEGLGGNFLQCGYRGKAVWHVECGEQVWFVAPGGWGSGDSRRRRRGGPSGKGACLPPGRHRRVGHLGLGYRAFPAAFHTIRGFLGRAGCGLVWFTGSGKGFGMSHFGRVFGFWIWIRTGAGRETDIFVDLVPSIDGICNRWMS